MGLKHIESAKRRWANTSVEERTRRSVKQRKAMKKYWRTQAKESRVARAIVAAAGRWGKETPTH